MYNALLDRMTHVTRRFRARLFWLAVSLFAIPLACLTYAAIDSARQGKLDGTNAAFTLLGLGIGGFVVAYLCSRMSFRDPRTIATKIEEKFPSLNQRLLTALSQKETAEGKQLGYLQTRVIREARDHSRDHMWVDTLPNGSLWSSRLVGMGATATLAVFLGILVSVKPNSDKRGITSLTAETAVEVLVEPGNTEIERGTSLAITARFAFDTPEEAELVCSSINADGEESVRRISMTQNLDDPIVGGFIASVDEKFTYQVVTKDWKSEEFTVDVFEFPSLVRSDAGLDFPEYTELEDKTVEDTVRVSAVEGTKVKWICFLNKPVESGELVDKDGNRIALTADADVDGALSTEFDLIETRRLTLELVDEAGRKNKYPPELVARVLVNQPPKLKLTNAKDSSVSPLEELPVGVEVRDDFGVAQVGLSYTFADHPPQDVVLKEKIGRGSKEKVDHLIAMEDLKAEPDQLLSYHFWAEDIGPDGEIRRTESDMFFAEVRPFEEIYREGEPPAGGEQQQQQQQEQSQNGEQAEELAKLQKEIINATWTVIRQERGDKPSEGFADNITLLTTSQLDAINQLEELSAELEDAESQSHAEAARQQMEKAAAELQKAGDGNYTRPLHPAMAAEQAAYGGLLKLRAREFQVTRQQQQQQQGQKSASQQNRQQQLDDLELNQEENRYETQKQAQQNSEEEQAEREVRQVLNRLRELAKRQQDLNKQLAELQSALEQAENQEEKEEIERQLKRLRSQEQDLLRETDELAERMDSPENAEEMADAKEQLQETRENVRKASEALKNSDASDALTAGKRAEREFEEMRDEFRQKAAGQFNDAVREMRSTAQQLDEQQEELAQQLQEIGNEEATPGLRGENNRGEIQKTLNEQRERLGELLDKMQETVEQAEVAEPLLAEKLYDSFRKTQQKQIDRKLKDTAELLNRGFDAEAKQIEQPAREGINELREEIEDAANSVLGDETEALRRALGELDQLSRDLDQEIQSNDPNAQQANRPGSQPAGEPSQEGGQGAGQPNSNGEERSRQNSEGERSEQTASGQRPGQQSGEEDRMPSDDRTRQGNGQSQQQNDHEREPGDQPPPGEGDQPSERPGQGQQSQEGQPGESQQPGQEQQPGQGQQPGQAQQPGEQPGQGQQPGQRPGQGRNPDGQPQDGQSRDGTQSGRQQNGGLSRFAAENPSSQPLTGEGFRDWSDRLRDVEEMVEDSELRSRAARIRDRAREVRIDVKRHSKDPQWRLVDEMIAQPLRELKRDVQEELVRRSAERNAMVPIDRDPVPDEFTDAVQRYYENLGSGR